MTTGDVSAREANALFGNLGGSWKAIPPYPPREAMNHFQEWAAGTRHSRSASGDLDVATMRRAATGCSRSTSRADSPTSPSPRICCPARATASSSRSAMCGATLEAHQREASRSWRRSSPLFIHYRNLSILSAAPARSIGGDRQPAQTALRRHLDDGLNIRSSSQIIDAVGPQTDALPLFGGRVPLDQVETAPLPGFSFSAD